MRPDDNVDLQGLAAPRDKRLHWTCEREALPKTRCARNLLGLGIVLIAVASCRKAEPIPTERLLVAKAPIAPGINELKENKAANRFVYQGEVFVPRSPHPEFRWEGVFEGQVTQRVGAVEAGRAAIDGTTFVFTSDFLEAQVPTASWLCGRMGDPVVFNTPCNKTLRRIVAPGTKLVTYITCPEPTCPLGELSAGALATTTVPGLSEVRVVTLAGVSVILAWSRWVRSQDWTGGQLQVFHLTPPLRRAGEVPLDEVDAREEKQVMNRLGTLQINPDSLVFVGKRTLLERQTGKELSASPVEEHYSLTATGELKRK